MTPREFDGLLERKQQFLTRYIETPIASICSAIANYAGKTLKEGVEFEPSDFLLRSKAEVEAMEEENRDARIRAQLASLTLAFGGTVDPSIGG